MAAISQQAFQLSGRPRSPKKGLSVQRATEDGRLSGMSACHEPVEDGREVVQFDQVRGCELAEDALGPDGESHADHARVAVIGDPADQVRGLGAVDQLDGAVMAQQQVLGQFADRGRQLAWMALDRDQELVLDVSQARAPGLLRRSPIFLWNICLLRVLDRFQAQTVRRHRRP